MLVSLPVLLLILFFTKDDISLSGNETSRLAVVESLVERGTFSIDGSFFKTEDRVFIGGRFYSDKPLLLPLFLGGIYKTLHILGLNFKDNYHLTVYLLNFAGGGFFALLLFLFFHRAIKPFNFSFIRTSLLSASLIFGSWLFSFSATLGNHVPAAFFLFLFFICFLKIKKINAPRLIISAGFLAGIILNIEIPAGLLISAVSLLFLMIVPERKLQDLSCFISGFAIPFAGMLAINYIAYGSIVPAYAVPGAYNFPGNIHSTAVAGLNIPESLLLYPFNILFGYRGLFSYMPALLFIIPYFMICRGKIKINTIFMFIFLLSFIIFYSLMTGDYGGWSYGFRFLIPVIPILWFYICEWFAANKNKTLKIIFAIAVVWGILTSAVGAYNPWPVCYEGSATNKGTVERNIKNPFLANVLCISHEFIPSSALAKYLESDIYGADISKIYIPKAFMNMKKISSLENPYKKENDLIDFAFNLLNVLLLFITFFFIIKTAQRLLAVTLNNSSISKNDYLVFMFLYVFVISCFITAICGFSGILKTEWLLTLSGILLVSSNLLRPGNINIETGFSKDILLITAPAIIFNGITASTNLPLTVSNWDAMTYHLYFPARWIQEGIIFHVPSVFGDNAPAFFPKCWMFFLTIFMAIGQSDAFLCVMPLIFLCGAAFCIFRISIFYGTDKIVAAGLAALFTCLPVISEYTFTANADIPMLFLILCAVSALLFYLKDGKYIFAVICVLSCGAAAGVKTVGILFALPILLIISLVILKRKSYAVLVLCPLFFILSGGWCYIENLILYGNPFFPLDISFGNIRIFAGAYGNEAVKAGEFHTSSLTMLHKILVKSYGLPTCLILPLGLAGYIYGITTSKEFRHMKITGLVLFAYWLFSYFFIVPHNTETRFLFPALAMAIPGAGILLNTVKKKEAATLAIVIICFFLIIPNLLVTKALSSAIPYAVLLPSILLISLCIISLSILMFFKASRNIIICTSVIILSTILFAFVKSKELRVYSLCSSDYSVWLADIFKPFNTPDGLTGTVAYSGNNLPYTFTGGNLRNKVIYCNVQGAFNDSFYDFWKHDKKVYNTHKPPLYRNNPNYNEWLGNIKSSGADFLLISVLYPAERKYIASNENGFPIEEAWASSHNDKFTLVMTGKYIKLYKINKGN